MPSTSTSLVFSGLAAIGLMMTSDSHNTPKGFPAQEVEVKEPIWAQFLMGSLLLTIFAAAVFDGEQEKPTKVGLKAGVIPQPKILALRFAVLLGLLGARGAIQATCFSNAPAVFPSHDVSVEAPEWTQLLFISILFFIFAAAVYESDEVQASRVFMETSHHVMHVTPIAKVRVVPQAHSLALRLALAAGLFGIHALGMDSSLMTTFSSAAPFPPEELRDEVPAWAQIMLASLLLCVFAYACDEDVIDKHEDNAKPSMYHVLPEAKTLARRFAAVAALLGTLLLGKALACSDLEGLSASCNAFDSGVSMGTSASVSIVVPRYSNWNGAFSSQFPMSALMPAPAFPPTDLTLQVSLWSQLLLVSLLLLTFAAATRAGEAEASDPSFLRTISWSFSILLGLFLVALDVVPMGGTMLVFPSTEVELGLPIWAQFGLGLVLLSVVLVLLQDDNGSNEDEERFDPAAWAGVASAFTKALQEEADNVDEKIDEKTDHSKNTQSLARKDGKDTEQTMASKSKALSLVMLVAGTCAAAQVSQMSLVPDISGVFESMVPDVSGESVYQGGLLVIGTAAVLSDGRVQGMLFREGKL